MPKPFDVVLPNKMVLKGQKWPLERPRASMIIQTGMQEYALRYDEFARYLNEHGIYVYCLDAFGQGLNAPNEEDQGKWPVDAFSLNVDALHQLLVQVKQETHMPVYLFGHSMGSFMVQSYLERYPLTADKAIICGSNGPYPFTMKMGYLLAKIIVTKKNWDEPSPFLSNLAMGSYAKAVEDRKTDLDWLAYDEKDVKDYIDDPYCGHPNSKGFWHEFLKGMASLYDKDNLHGISQQEKIFIISGSDDPVGKCSKGVEKLFHMYQDLGLSNVEMKIYPHMRHEILNETNKQLVYEDVLKFINK